MSVTADTTRAQPENAEIVYITKLEKQLLLDLAQTCHSSDGHGFSLWLGQGYESMPMSQARALVSTLIQKGVLNYYPPEHGCPGNITVTDRHIERSDDYYGEDHEYGACPFTVGIYGHKYVNLEVQ
jgi:hypothetical protein|tara:strand:+ start:122 stop:499 length:378 start_codon:yes stop_codon:yes gene_type:complete